MEVIDSEPLFIVSDRGRHSGYPSFNVLAGGPGSLAERSAGDWHPSTVKILFSAAKYQCWAHVRSSAGANTMSDQLGSPVTLIAAQPTKLVVGERRIRV
jgi:hypothetical protein